MKQVIVVNNSLKLPRGKLAAQVAHGAVAAFLQAASKARQIWIDEGMPKIVVKADDDDALKRLLASARDRKIPTYLVHDAGKTVLAAGTVTCLGLGPAEDEALDALTAELKLL